MEKLPKETFLSVISYLDLDSKLRCLRVSHKWHDWIKAGGLYRRLVFESENRLEKAVRYLYHQKCKETVHELSIRKVYMPALLMANLSDTFPCLKNLVVVPFDEADEEYFAPDDFNLLAFDLAMQKWNKLERIEETHFLPITVSILKSPIPTHLTSIKITYSWDSSYLEATESSYVENYFKLQTLIKYLYNAPQLKSLELINIFITLQDMEDLHQNTPNLKTLKLQKMMLCLHTDIESVIDSAYLSSITKGVKISQVANSVEEIVLSTMDNSSSEDELNDAAIIKWLEYTGQKYTELSNFCFHRAMDDITSPTGFKLEKPLAIACRNWHRLKSYDTNTCPLSMSILKELDEFGVRLDHLGISGNRMTLEEQLLFVQLSEQSQHINSMKIRYCNDNFRPQDGPNHKWISLISVFSNLHTLTVSSRVEQSEYEIDMLPMVLTHVSTLKYFSIGRMFANVRSDTRTELKHPTGLEHLNIMRCGITNETELNNCNSIMSNVLKFSPKLNTFIFETDGYYESRLIHHAEKKKKQMALELNFEHLENLRKIEIDFEESPYYKIVQGTGRSRWYYQKEFYVGLSYTRARNFKKVSGLPSNQYLYAKIRLRNTNKPVIFNSRRLVAREFTSL